MRLDENASGQRTQFPPGSSPNCGRADVDVGTVRHGAEATDGTFVTGTPIGESVVALTSSTRSPGWTFTTCSTSGRVTSFRVSKAESFAYE